ncbi:hypothetical protein AAG598_03150 [Citromicrobium bathyomarinum]
MVRRSPPRAQLDNRAFPVRVLVHNEVSDALTLRLTEAQAWLNDNIGRGEWAMHGQANIGLHAMGIYFRSIDAAERFFDAHPHFELVDTTGQLQHVAAARRLP